jgi:hypothetical protein
MQSLIDEDLHMCSTNCSYVFMLGQCMLLSDQLNTTKPIPVTHFRGLCPEAVPLVVQRKIFGSLKILPLHLRYWLVPRPHIVGFPGACPLPGGLAIWPAVALVALILLSRDTTVLPQNG